ncbi:MAG: transglutaminase domain-containing protein [Ferruginibacter sp.]
MKYLLFLFLILIYNSKAFCQDDFFTRTFIPASETATTSTIAYYIKSHFKTDKEKFTAAYNWVIQNIKYDTDSMYSINWSKGHEAIVSDAMRRRKGVCENYAAIFCDIASKTGLSAFAVQGLTRQNGKADKTDHTWCAIELNKEWFLCDPTWDNGEKYLLKYFMVSPEIFIQTHMPYDPMWQLLEYPISHAEFNRGVTTGMKSKTIFNFRDSIMIFNQLTELQQLEKTASRIVQESNANQLIKNRLTYTRMLIEIEKQDEDLNLYNTAVSHLNKANNFYNNYLSFRNTGFSPAIPRVHIYNLLDSASTQLLMVKLIIKRMEKREPSYQYDPGALIERIAGLSKKLDTEHAFLKNNFSSLREK